MSPGDREETIINQTIIAAPIVALIAGLVVWLFEPQPTAVPAKESPPYAKEVAEV